MKLWTAEDFVDSSLQFDEPSHCYTYSGRPLTSVTTFLHQFQVPFDADFHSRRIAKKTGVPQAAVLAEWQEKADSAAALGTAVHAEAERIGHNVLAYRSFTTKDGSTPLSGWRAYAVGVRRWYVAHSELFHGYTIPEVRLVHPGWGLAGTCDLICNLYGRPTIVDWKTSQTIRPFGFRNLLPPVDHLPDCEYYLYSLQLHLYRAMLAARYSYHAEQLCIVHLGADGSYREIPAANLENATQELLIWA